MTTDAPVSLSSIMDGNSFRIADLDRLTPTAQQLVLRRQASLGPSYRLFYRTPVHAVSGSGAYLYDADGTRILDAYNNVPSVGHAHPAVADAVSAQMRKLNTHTRYLQDGIVSYSEQLLATLPDHIGSIMFTNSGSESNDLAIRIARLWTGGQGIVVTAEAYHGTTELLSRVSPAISGGFPDDDTVRIIPAPDAYRVDTDDIGAWFADRVREAFDDLIAHGIRPAAFLADSIFSSDGIYPDPRGFLAPAIDVVHAYGALFIADEVQPGFVRTGSTFWGFERHGVEADLVSMGKPMGNGIPVAALAGRGDILARFGKEVPYFNTFGGNSVSIAAAQAVLDVIQSTDLIRSVDRTGRLIREGIAALAVGRPHIGDVRGSGLYIGVDIVTDPESKTPDSAAALAIVNALRERNVLISVAGPGNNVLKIRPPLVFGEPEAVLLLETLDTVLEEVAPR
ncbi:MAG: aspartate aminotransferase family protein [Candidatus Microbacterium phytovorans]|uniref:Aspartate aminotransferase family protein n=1 Tax=Candidatus Microbacterium phytovorans TaxID=3121374 RepID=A0AAJ5W1N1_9MICO|nr:aspartate aminotransferase family protein [Microbacterium sp.]WEK12991.1 MAG: aspartate aminotransferase family protein [Microbacterium sp.]